jgi:hypothetical protein
LKRSNLVVHTQAAASVHPSALSLPLRNCSLRMPWQVCSKAVAHTTLSAATRSAIVKRGALAGVLQSGGKHNFVRCNAKVPGPRPCGGLLTMDRK